ncbi:hypothetical protein OEZ86_006437 [Tetradesmus obliquus]|nr:hypothetical protein OEZ86_006437 [Tetradesmus obliquus]
MPGIAAGDMPAALRYAEAALQQMPRHLDMLFFRANCVHSMMGLLDDEHDTDTDPTKAAATAAAAAAALQRQRQREDQALQTYKQLYQQLEAQFQMDLSYKISFLKA